MIEAVFKRMKVLVSDVSCGRPRVFCRVSPSAGDFFNIGHGRGAADALSDADPRFSLIYFPTIPQGRNLTGFWRQNKHDKRGVVDAPPLLSCLLRERQQEKRKTIPGGLFFWERRRWRSALKLWQYLRRVSVRTPRYRCSQGGMLSWKTAVTKLDSFQTETDLVDSASSWRWWWWWWCGKPPRQNHQSFSQKQGLLEGSCVVSVQLQETQCLVYRIKAEISDI